MRFVPRTMQCQWCGDGRLQENWPLIDAHPMPQVRTWAISFISWLLCCYHCLISKLYSMHCWNWACLPILLSSIFVPLRKEIKQVVVPLKATKLWNTICDLFSRKGVWITLISQQVQLSLYNGSYPAIVHYCYIISVWIHIIIILIKVTNYATLWGIMLYSCHRNSAVLYPLTF